MATILERNKSIKQPVQKKTREDYAEDALYREVWEDVNNEKTQLFFKKYWKYITIVAITIMIAVSGVQIGKRMYHKAQLATAVVYETAIANIDAAALASLSNNTSGAMSDLAMFQSYVIDKDIKKLEMLAKDGNTRDFKDLAKLHIASIRGDEMTVVEFEKYLADLNTKKSPFFYTYKLMFAQKLLADNFKEHANEILDEIISDKFAPSTIVATAQMLK